MPRVPSGRNWLAVLGRPAMVRLAVVAGLVLAWEWTARQFGNPLFVSPPSHVAVAMFGLLRDPEILHGIALTCWELIAAFALSVVIGLGVGLLVGLHRFTRASFYPIVLVLYAVPLVTILPLFVLVFGIGPASKIAFGACHGVFPIILTVSAGVQNIDPVLLTSARSMGASRRQIVSSVVFPHMVPAFFTGMRLAMTTVLLGVLLAELYVSQAGVGHFASQFTQTFQPQKLFALIVLLAAIAVTLNEACRWGEKRFSRWQAR
ncbi:MAG TPA: ABC transporter permease subunit [Patescibacteria group bacterium]|nr:ABC transporter permease subunit [Patescibacteria group bacterium]